VKNPSALKIIGVRTNELTAARIAATKANDPQRAETVTVELEQLAMLADVLKYVAGLSSTKSPDFELLNRQLDRPFARWPRLPGMTRRGTN
jgi:hypothetical protein